MACSSSLGFAQRLAVLPRDDCIEDRVAARMVKQLDVLEARARFFVSRMLGSHLETRVPIDLFAPRYVGLYGGRKRSSTGGALYDQNCSGANITDNRKRSSSRFGKTVLIRHILPALVRSVASGALEKRNAPSRGENECYDYVSLPNARFHLLYDVQGRRMLEAQMSIAAALALVDALQQASIPGLEMRSGYDATIAFRSTLYDPVEGTLNSRMRQSVECRIVEVTRDVVHRFVDQIRAKLAEFEHSGIYKVSPAATTTIPAEFDAHGMDDELHGANIPDDELTGSYDDATCSKYNGGTHYLIEVSMDRSLERLAYELGYSTIMSREVDMELTREVVAHDVCNLIPMFASRDTIPPVELFVRGTFPFFKSDLLSGNSEAGVGICRFSHERSRTTESAISQRRVRGLSPTTGVPSSTPARTSTFECSWIVLSRPDEV